MWIPNLKQQCWSCKLSTLLARQSLNNCSSQQLKKISARPTVSPIKKESPLPHRTYLRFCGNGMPCVMIVDSNATTGLFLSSASDTSLWIEIWFGLNVENLTALMQENLGARRNHAWENICFYKITRSLLRHKRWRRGVCPLPFVRGERGKHACFKKQKIIVSNERTPKTTV